jgi:hypothetical protein
LGEAELHRHLAGRRRVVFLDAAGGYVGSDFVLKLLARFGLLLVGSDVGH